MKETTDATFETDVLKASGHVLIDFWAPWCGPCKNMMPLLEEALKEQKDLAAFSLNIDDNPETPTGYNIMSIPTLILFKDGKMVETHVGSFHTKSDISTWLNKARTA